MSLDIRYVTNGTVSVYRVLDSAAEAFNIYEKKEDIPQSIRHYAPDTPKFAGPDFAAWIGVQHILYPNFPKCGHPEFVGKACIAESCKYAAEAGAYVACPYFDKNYSK